MNDAHLFLSQGAVQLARLNGTERRVLRLLAEGHTAKSIAVALGCSPAAVNERLREARRKTGAGSSRELARLLRTQENRDEQIGVGRGQLAGATPAKSGARPWRTQMGVSAMIAIFAVAAAGAAALVFRTPPSSNDADPIEAAIRARVMQIPLVGTNGNILRVKCGVALCEIAGTLNRGEQPTTENDPDLPINRAAAALQDKSLSEDLAKLGLKKENSIFVSGEGKPRRDTFLLHYSREEKTPE